jgi:aminopeptidase N
MMNHLQRVGALALLLLVAAADAGTPRSAADWGGFQDGWRFLSREASQPGGTLARDGERRDSLHSWDQLEVAGDLWLGHQPANLVAQVSIRGVARQSLNQVDLHLRGYQISEVRVDGIPRPHNRDEDLLTVQVMPPLAPADTFLLELAYSGLPVVHDGVGLFVQPALAYTFSDPWGTRNWLACYDEPFDKSLWRLSVRADSTFATLCNGTLDSVHHNGDGTSSWSWSHAFPMSSYLVSLVSGRLEILEDEWQGLPLRWFVYPQHVAQAWESVSRMDQMLACYTALWGDYPFENYAMGEAPIFGGMGGMEHQTCTTIGSGIIAGGLQYESIIAHELSHMWWGDSVTPVDFQHVWLNEGWATYAEALFYQFVDGGDEAALLAYLEQIQQTYLNWDSQFDPIFDPPDDNLFTVNQYEKAASVLHMLRDLLGPTLFDEAQRTWHATHAYGTVDTEEYRAHLEAASGQELGWFFLQWIYSGGYPTYTLTTEARSETGGTRVHLTVSQSHPRLDRFRARVPIRIATLESVLDTLVWIDQPAQQFSWLLEGSFDTLLFNYKHPVLCRQLVVPPAPGPPRWELLSHQLDDSQAGNGDGDLAPGESAALSLTLRNSGGWDTGIAFALGSPDLEVGGTWAILPESSGGMVHTLPLGPVVVSGWSGAGTRFVDLHLTSTSEAWPAETTTLRLPVGDPWLLVAARSSQSGLLPYVVPELDSLSVFSDGLDPGVDSLPLPLRPDHKAVIWLTGAAGQTLSAEELSWIDVTYTDGQAAVLISGQDALDSLTTPAFAHRFLPLSRDLNEVRVDGEGPFADLTALLIGSGGAQNQSSPSSLQCLDCNNTSTVLARYRTSGEPAILMAELMDASGRVIVAGFGLEAISGMAGTSSRREWLDRLARLLDVGLPVARESGGSPLPAGLEVGSAHPNPFNPITRLPYRLAQAGQVQVKVHDLLGRVVLEWDEGRRAAGSHALTVDGSELASGLYVVRLEAGGASAEAKILLIK